MVKIKVKIGTDYKGNKDINAVSEFMDNETRLIITDFGLVIIHRRFGIYEKRK